MSLSSSIHASQDIFWGEARCAQEGCLPSAGQVSAGTLPASSMDLRAYTYGGGAFAVISFSQLADGGLACQRSGGPARLLRNSAGLRDADLQGQYLICGRTDQEAENTRVSGNDFSAAAHVRSWWPLYRAEKSGPRALHPMGAAHRSSGLATSALKNVRGQTLFSAGSASSLRAPALVACEQACAADGQQEIDFDPDDTWQPGDVVCPAERGETASVFSCKRADAPVRSHPGPTPATETQLCLTIWSCAGDGRRLQGQSGVIDVETCSNGVLHLRRGGQVDSRRRASGSPTLCALLCDALVLNMPTCESQSPGGPYPECKDLYQQRSPMHVVACLCCPAERAQGSADPITTPEQAELMVQVRPTRGRPVVYLLFEDEGHRLERTENRVRALDSELFFSSRLVGLTLPNPGGHIPDRKRVPSARR
jgi:hypothetical protein